MSELRRSRERARAFLHKTRRDSELDAELDAHLAMAIEENLDRGMPPAEARRQALIRLGGVPQAQEMQREARGLMNLDILLQDLKFTVRTLAMGSGFTAISVLILALGIGANVAVFSVVNTMLLGPLPLPHSEQLVWFTGGKGFDAKMRSSAGLSGETYTVDVYREFQRNNQSFQAVTTYQTFYNSVQYKMTGSGEPAQLDVVEVADNFFPTLGVQPALGRNFTEEECLKGSRSTAMLSYFFWKTQFASDPAIVGKSVTINNRPTTIVGVLPASFDFGALFAPGKNVDLFVPAVMDFWKTWGNTLAMVGRVKPTVTIAQAQAEADQLFPRLKQAHEDWFYDYASDLTMLKDHVTGKLRRSLVVLWSAVGFILLIVCVNLSNLQLSRAATRSKEFAMRRALGASRARLVRQLLTESLILSLTGSALGLAIAFAVVHYLTHQSSITLPLLASLRVDAASLVWTLILAISVGTLFGLAPALRISGENLQETIKESATGMSADRSHERFRGTLVISEIALACVLLVGAGLLLRSFLRILSVNLGFEPTHAAAMQIDLPPAGNKDQLIQRVNILKSEIDRVGALPGVRSVAVADMLPLDRNRQWGVQSVGRPHAKDADTGALVYLVTPGYFQAMGMRLRSGRDFSWDDKPDNQHVLVINEAAARREWPGEDPVGKLAYATGKDPDRVIGVIADVRESSLEQRSSPEIYVPITQNSDVEGATLVVRSAVPPSSLAGSILSALRTINPAQPASEFRPLQMLVDRAVSPRRFFVLLVTIFAGFGVLLAALGIYGVISYSVSQRTREIGVRMALGANASDVQRLVLMKTMRLAAVGVAAGSAVSIGVARAIASLLYETGPGEPLAYVAMVGMIGAVTLLAGFIPAWRASRVNPTVALRAN